MEQPVHLLAEIGIEVDENLQLGFPVISHGAACLLTTGIEVNAAGHGSYDFSLCSIPSGSQRH